MANRTTYIDSFTGNATHVARVGAILCAPEHAAYQQLRDLQVRRSRGLSVGWFVGWLTVG